MAEVRKAYGIRLLEISLKTTTAATTATTTGSSSSSSSSADHATATSMTTSSSSSSGPLAPSSGPVTDATSLTGQPLARWLIWRLTDWYMLLPEIKEVGEVRSAPSVATASTKESVRCLATLSCVQLHKKGMISEYWTGTVHVMGSSVALSLLQCVWSFRPSSPLRLPHLKFLFVLFIQKPRSQSQPN